MNIIVFRCLLCILILLAMFSAGNTEVYGIIVATSWVSLFISVTLSMACVCADDMDSAVALLKQAKHDMKPDNETKSAMILRVLCHVSYLISYIYLSSNGEHILTADILITYAAHFLAWHKISNTKL